MNNFPFSSRFARWWFAAAWISSSVLISLVSTQLRYSSIPSKVKPKPFFFITCHSLLAILLFRFRLFSLSTMTYFTFTFSPGADHFQGLSTDSGWHDQVRLQLLWQPEAGCCLWQCPKCRVQGAPCRRGTRGQLKENLIFVALNLIGLFPDKRPECEVAGVGVLHLLPPPPWQCQSWQDRKGATIYLFNSCSFFLSFCRMSKIYCKICNPGLYHCLYQDQYKYL